MSKNPKQQIINDARPGPDYKVKTDIVKRIKEAIPKRQWLTNVVLDRDTAADLLTLNHGNRDPKIADVERYAIDMLNGNWVNNVDPFTITEAGNLINGQKRSWAIIVASFTEPTHIIIDIQCGAKEAAAPVMDTGVVRSLSDALQDRGFKDTNNLAAAIRLIFYMEKFQRIGTYIPKYERMTNDQCVQWTNNTKNIDLLEKILQKTHVVAKRVRFIQKSGFAAMWYLFHKKNAGDAAYFMEHLASGADLNTSQIKDHNIYRLREKLIQLDHNPEERTSSHRKDERYRYLIFTWNMYRRNERIIKLKPDFVSVDIERPV